MKNLFHSDVIRYRSRHPYVMAYYGSAGDDKCGVFVVPSPIDGAELRIVASAGGDWDHVSVSRANRPPNWPEMSRVHRLFFEGDETAMQLHVPASDHINHHPHCLHLWRPHAAIIPRPPAEMVGPPVSHALSTEDTPTDRHR